MELAKRQTKKLKIALTGISGTGKTLSALKLASGIGSKIGVIDSELNSSLNYADTFKFFHSSFESPYDPYKLIELIREMEKSGADVIIIDSLSHIWNGEGGILNIANTSKAGWMEANVVMNDFFKVLQNLKCHLICTLRSKTGFVTNDCSEEIKKGTIGIVHKDGIEYDFDIVFDLQSDHVARIYKQRLSTDIDEFYGVLEEKHGILLRRCSEGEEIPNFLEEKFKTFLIEVSKNDEDLEKKLNYVKKLVKEKRFTKTVYEELKSRTLEKLN